MGVKPLCINSIFFPGNINASSGSTPVRLPRVTTTLSAAAGSYALTGLAAMLRGNTGLSSGNFVLTGRDAVLRTARIFPTAAGSFSLSGVAATLNKGRTVSPDSGAYTSSGVSATLSAGRSLDAFATGLTGAWSISRQLLSSYTANAGAFYHITSGTIDTIYDQSGNSRNVTDGGTASRRPSVSTAGSNSVACADFDGSSDYLTGAAISNFISNSSGYMIITAFIDVVTLNNASVFNNDLLIGDSGEFLGIYLKNDGSPPHAFGYNFDGNSDSNNTSFSTSAVHVFEWRHESGTVFLTIDGTEVSAASGNTTTMTGLLAFFGRGNQWANGKMFEAAIWSTPPSSGDRTTIRNAFKNYAGT